MKLMIAIPTNRDWKAGFYSSLIDTMIEMSSMGLHPGLRVLSKVSNIASGRKKLLQQAIDGGFSHILFIDDDMAFEPKAFKFLASRDCSFVAANAVTKPNIAGIKLEEAPRITAKDKDKNPVSSLNKTGIEPVERIGLAFALLRIEDIKKIPDPHFALSESSGEDYFFCQRAIEHGIDIYVDHDATKHVVHIGDYPFCEE